MALFTLIWSASSFPISPEWNGIYAYRYLAPIAPFLFATLALAVGRLPLSVSLIVTAALVGPNLARIVVRLPAADPLAFRLSGSSYIAYGAHLIDRLGGSHMEALARVEQMPEGPARRAATGVIISRPATNAWPDPGVSRAPWLEAQLADQTIPGRYRADHFSRLALLFDLVRKERLTPLAGRELLAVLEPHPATEVAPLVRAVVGSVGRDSATTAADLCDLVAALPVGLREAGGRGLGVVAVRRAEIAAAGQACAASLALDSAFAYGAGFEWALAQLHVGVAAARPSFPVRGADFATGVADAVSSYDIEDPVRRQMAARRLSLGLR